MQAGTASSELLSALSSDDFSLEVKLMSTGATRLDMNSIAQPGTLQVRRRCGGWDTGSRDEQEAEWGS